MFLCRKYSMKMNLFLLFFAIFGISSLQASTPQAAKPTSPTTVKIEAEWVLVLKIGASGIETKPEQKEIVEDKKSDTNKVIAEGWRVFQNDPKRYGLFPWENN